MHEVSARTRSLERVSVAIGPERLEALQQRIARSLNALNGRTIWHVNSTAVGGGVAEMLQPLLGYAHALGLDFRWLVIDGDPEFFAITKRIHNHLHGHPGDGGHLAERERTHYEGLTAANAHELCDRIKPGDIVICHDPQTGGLVPHLRRHGAFVIWRSHIGHDQPNELVNHAWRFLAPYLKAAHRYVFTRRSYVPQQLDHGMAVIIPPSIDPLSPKNQPMSDEVARSILVTVGVLEGPEPTADPVFTREDGSIGRVQHCADVIHLGRAPKAERRLVTQVSRWDSLKDPLGVLDGFAEYLAGDSASLVLAGPNVSAVADDPEGGRVLDQVFVAWRELPHEIRKHIHIACLPMADREENAAIVNALQRHSRVVVQKSLYEGFGLTVTEAMWKGKPVVASAVGGIRDQIESGVHGLLIDDPLDLDAFAVAVQRVLADQNFADQLGEAARRRVEENFLFIRHVTQYLDLFDAVLAEGTGVKATA